MGNTAGNAGRVDINQAASGSPTDNAVAPTPNPYWLAGQQLNTKENIMNKQEYNGWTNYETWAVNLWMDNEQGSQEYWHGIAKELMGDTDSPVHKLSELIKEQHEESLPELTGFAADLLNGAMSEVNWYEIAKTLIEAVQEQAA